MKRGRSITRHTHVFHRKKRKCVKTCLFPLHNQRLLHFFLGQDSTYSPQRNPPHSTWATPFLATTQTIYIPNELVVMSWDLVSHNRTCTHPPSCAGKWTTDCSWGSNSWQAPAFLSWAVLQDTVGFSILEEECRHVHPHLAKSAFPSTSTRSYNKRSSTLRSFIFLNCPTEQRTGEQQLDGNAQEEEGQGLKAQPPCYWILGDPKLPHKQLELRKQKLLVKPSHNPSPKGSSHFSSLHTLTIAPEAQCILGTSTFLCQCFASQDGQHFQKAACSWNSPTPRQKA